MADQLSDKTERLDITLNLPQTVFKDFGLLVDHADRLEEIQTAISANQDAASLDAICSKIASITQIPQFQIKPIVTTLLKLSELTAKARTTASQLVDLIADTAESSASVSWRERYLSKWKSSRDEIARAIEGVQKSEVLLAVSKASRLTYTHQNILTDINIITELRPVFSETGDRVLQMVLTHYLMIEYSSGKGSDRIQLAVDAADIEDLKERCIRAQVKMATLKETLGGQPWYLSIPRDPSTK